MLQCPQLYPTVDTWKDRCEDAVQAYDEDMIRDLKRSEVEDEIRKQVDVLMREELDLLKIVSTKKKLPRSTLHLQTLLQGLDKGVEISQY